MYQILVRIHFRYGAIWSNTNVLASARFKPASITYLWVEKTFSTQECAKRSGLIIIVNVAVVLEAGMHIE